MTTTRTERHRQNLSLHAIADADDMIKRGKEQLAEAVAIARSVGVSWEAIGAELGISRQAAYDRFKSAT